MGRLCQGVGTVTNGTGNRVEGTNTFHVIKFVIEPTSEDSQTEEKRIRNFVLTSSVRARTI